MKIKNLWIAAAALAMTGCSQNEITEMNPDANPAIGFSVFTGTQTKGLVTNGSTTADGVTTGLQSTGFGVLAYYTGQSDMGTSAAPNFMWNQEVTYTGGWTYAPLKYWPNTDGDKVSFFAYGPYEGTPSGASNVVLSDKTTTGYPTLKFTVDMDAPEDMVDLVATNAAQTGANKTMNLTKSSTAVPFLFKHVLSRADFVAKLDVTSITNTETKVFVTGIKLRGTGSNTSSKLFATATYKFQDGTWNYTTGGAATLQTTDVDLVKDNFWNGIAQSFGTDKFITKSVALDADKTEVSLFKTNQYLFLIPPTGNGISVAATDVQVELTYHVVTIDDKLDGGKSDVETTAIVSLPENTLKAGSAYKYIFTIGLEGVKVSATVDAWGSEEEVAAPSATATALTTEAMKAAIAALNTIKDKDKNCNYFVIYAPVVTVSSPTTLDLSSATDGNFKSGDKIEINLSKATVSAAVSVTPPANWKVSPASSSNKNTPIILTKD